MRGLAQRTAVILECGSSRAGAYEPALRDSGVTVVNRTTDPREAVDLLADLDADLLIVTDSRNDWNWLREARERAPSARIVVVGDSRDPERIASTLLAGATAYVIDGAAEGDLGVAVRQSFQRSLYVEREERTGGQRSDGPRLTPRETEILSRAVDGMSNREIACAFRITQQTVRCHLANIFRKLGVENRAGASGWAEANAFAPVDGPAPATVDS